MNQKAVSIIDAFLYHRILFLLAERNFGRRLMSSKIFESFSLEPCQDASIFSMWSTLAHSLDSIL
ncbi:hypothetical protein KSD_96920 [Ktedonobacter sp. SOSP1-85]|nr:hypothetical protein KSD_96920 [Ktedonobacter sp. SOSP1-85]